MKILLGLVIAVAASSPVLAAPVLAPAPELAAGIPAVLAAIGAFTATRLGRRR